jgi:hypothetical protein
VQQESEQSDSDSMGRLINFEPHPARALSTEYNVFLSINVYGNLNGA